MDCQKKKFELLSQYLSENNNTDIFTNIETKDIVKAILSYRDLAKELFSKFSDHMIKDLQNSTFNGRRYYPCDIVVLSNILNSGYIFNLSCLGLFSLDFCKKHLLDFPVLVGLSMPNKEDDIYGGLNIETENPLNISGIIERIYLRDHNLSQEQIQLVNYIVNRSDTNATVNILGDIPGLRNEDVKSFSTVYNSMKVADASSSEDPGTVYLEGEPVAEKDYGIVKGPSLMPMSFDIGSKVRLRNTGIGFNQIYGLVKSVSPSDVVIEWENGKLKGRTSTFNASDMIKLYATLEKIS